MKSICHFAQEQWKKIVNEGDTVIDATLGNGKDTLFLAKLVGPHGHVIGYEIQPQGIEKTKNHLTNEGLLERVTLKLRSHEFFEEKSSKLIVYNLGYLPGGDKSVTTTSHATMKSLTSALSILEKGGLLSVMTYVGHAEGKKEFEEVSLFFKTFPKQPFKSVTTIG